MFFDFLMIMYGILVALEIDIVIYILKVSYSAMPNMGSIINRAATKAPIDEATAICNCRIPEDCPLQGSCNIKGIVYEAEVTPVSSTNGIGIKKYIGLMAERFQRNEG